MQRARNNIDVYSKAEVDSKVDSKFDLADYAKPSDLDSRMCLDYNKKQIVIHDSINNNWKCVCYGDGKFIAGQFDTVAYSDDGIIWHEGNCVKGVKSICYGNGKFVGLQHISASSSCAICSEDGINWIDNDTYMPDDIVGAGYDSICYGNGKYVAVGIKEGYGHIAYSEDGITWTETKILMSASSVCYGANKFVIVGSYTFGRQAAYSEDGITWNLVDMSATHKLLSVCYGNGKFVAVGDNTGKYCGGMYSEDGITWVKTDLPIGYYDSICYGNGKYVAVGIKEGYGHIAYSEDGITWTETNLPIGSSFVSICYDNGKFIAICNNGCVAYSEDGIAWVTQYNFSPKSIVQFSENVTSDVASIIKPHLNLTASDVGALPSDTVIPDISGLATETYVDTALASLVNSAPEALNTLDELAAALGDDSNFATTVTNQIASKQDAITGTAGQFVVIGADGKPTTKTIPYAEEATF